MEKQLNEKHILKNGLKKSFTGKLEEIIKEITTFFNHVSIQEIFIIIIKCDQSNEITMDDIGLINDTIQKDMLNKASFTIHIEESDCSENTEYELLLHYFLQE